MKSQNAGAKSEGFTLIELLVVISIIALLLAILVPGLQKAKELANRIKCASNIKNLSTASCVYSDTHNGYFVPVGYVGGRQPKTFNQYDNDLGDTLWRENKAFRKYLGIEDYITNKKDWTLPDEFICPDDKISKRLTENDDRSSYGYNVTDWSPWSHKYTVVGHKADAMKRPAESLAFVDSVIWWVDLNGADYEYVWDTIRDLYDPRQAPDEVQWGAVFYRHSEGAVAGFYDGHAEWLGKKDIFDKDGYDDTPLRAGMWTSSGYVHANWNKRWP